MIPALTSSGLLPVGRFPATTQEIEQAFVADPSWASSTTRSTIWNDWTQITAQARSVVPIAAAWLGGSFLTSKVDPDDLDIVYVIDSRLADAVTNTLHKGFLAVLSQGQALRQIRGKRLDTFVINWVPDPEAQRIPRGFKVYAEDRGYWDDLWQRKLNGAKTAPRVPADALPIRGYLEVILDDFQP